MDICKVQNQWGLETQQQMCQQRVGSLLLSSHIMTLFKGWKYTEHLNKLAFLVLLLVPNS